MPHDARGNILKSGDRVLVPFIVKEIYSGDEFCNAFLETEIPMYPGDSKTALTINTRQSVRANIGDDTSFTAVVDEAGSVSYE